MADFVDTLTAYSDTFYLLMVWTVGMGTVSAILAWLRAAYRRG